MFVTPAYAQTTGATPDILISVLPFVLIFVIMYFLIIRPQRQQLKKRSEMLTAVRRGDTIDSIARKHGVTKQSIVALNGLANAHRIKAGQRLYLPKN